MGAVMMVMIKRRGEPYELYEPYKELPDAAAGGGGGDGANLGPVVWKTDDGAELLDKLTELLHIHPKEMIMPCGELPWAVEAVLGH